MLRDMLSFLIGWDPEPPPPPAFGLTYEGRYWSAKIDDISLLPPDWNIVKLSHVLTINPVYEDKFCILGESFGYAQGRELLANSSWA